VDLSELAQRLGVASKGPSDHPVRGIRDIERLTDTEELEDDQVYFIESAAVLRRHPLAGPRGIVLTVPELADRFACALVVPPKEIRPAFIRLLSLFERRTKFPAGVAPGAHVHESAEVDPAASVLPGAVIMEGARVGARCVVYPGAVLEPHAQAGEDTVLYPGAVLGHHCTIGRRGIVHGGAVIGADGFGFYDQPGRRYKIPQIGNVEIADDVEIGAGSTIDRATIESTRIGEQTKIDDQVHIGHNCQVGRYVYVAGNSAVAGSVVIEDGVLVSGMVCILDHVRLARGTMVMGVSGIVRDTEPGRAYFGTPARPARQMHRINATLDRLPDLLTRVRELEARLAAKETLAGAD